MTLDTKINIPDCLFLQKVDNETILLDSNTNEYFSINEIGTLIWETLEEKKDLNSVKEEIISNYEVDEKQVEKDILNFIQEVVNKGLITIS
ncbi:PqqD family protein [Arcobacter arenosus]|uniref:PqqD family protein n=1 Tax=Arcobacter arenosus TaxID=2576037 RepID=A0A5R8XZ12_9BACT|nr:PqqD family protein [Arcobacter arenosus]TLP36837.1 PqqD family protein [Arcobacter arenosus]